MRFRLITTALLCIAFFNSSSLEAQAHFLRGDANDDSSIDIADSTYIFTFLFIGGGAPPCMDAGDLNDDGGVDISDGVYGLNFLFTGGAPPAEPFSYWDADPTADALSCRGDCLEQTGDITEDTTWTKDNCYLLVDLVFVRTGATLTIEAGTTVLGDSETEGLLVVERGAQLVCNGTANLPVVFTSEKAVGERGRGDWGGLILLGNGDSNVPGKEAPAEGLDNQFWGGGENVVREDSSGSLHYTRVEFGGTEVTPDNEVNAISLFGCGSGTELDHVMCKMNLDDGFEWFGGDASLRYGMAVGIRDDSFDYSFGWRGRGQFWVCQQRGDDADRGFEIDNSESEFAATPLTRPMVSNITLIGDPDEDEGTESDTGLLFRRGAGSIVANAIVAGFKDAGFDIDDDETAANWASGDLNVTYSVFHNNGFGSGDNHCDVEEDAGDSACADAAEASSLWNAARNNVAASDSPIVDPYTLLTPDFRPQNDALTNFTDPTAIDSWFEAADYCGAVSGDESNWTNARWLSYLLD